MLSWKDEMNIFVLSETPKIAAQYHCDKHVVKMILESATMLSASHYHANPNVSNDLLFKYGWKNHPCTVWARQSISNYLWLAEMAFELCSEYTTRYKKVHKTFYTIKWLLSNIPQLPNLGLTSFAQAMPEQYKASDAVAAYRSYYIHEKAYFAKWKTEAPEWWPK